MARTLRECPFAGCNRLISPDLFACYSHWMRLPKSSKDAIWSAYRDYQRGDIDVEELRKRQQEVLDLEALS